MVATTTQKKMSPLMMFTCIVLQGQLYITRGTSQKHR
jgi:hypothetical protein